MRAICSRAVFVHDVDSAQKEPARIAGHLANDLGPLEFLGMKPDREPIGVEVPLRVKR